MNVGIKRMVVSELGWPRAVYSFRCRSYMEFAGVFRVRFGSEVTFFDGGSVSTGARDTRGVASTIRPLSRPLDDSSAECG